MIGELQPAFPHGTPVPGGSANELLYAQCLKAELLPDGSYRCLQKGPVCRVVMKTGSVGRRSIFGRLFRRETIRDECQPVPATEIYKQVEVEPGITRLVAVDSQGRPIVDKTFEEEASIEKQKELSVQEPEGFAKRALEKPALLIGAAAVAVFGILYVLRRR